MLLPVLPDVAGPVRVAPAVAVELPVRERIAGPLGAIGTAVPVLLVQLVRRLVLLPPAATVAGLTAVATWSAVAFAELRQLDPGTRRR